MLFAGGAGGLYAEGAFELLALVVAMLDTNSHSRAAASPNRIAKPPNRRSSSRFASHRPPDTLELARMACLSESKLSRVFGRSTAPIHAYVIDHASEWARAIIEVEGLERGASGSDGGYANPEPFLAGLQRPLRRSPSGSNRAAVKGPDKEIPIRADLERFSLEVSLDKQSIETKHSCDQGGLYEPAV